LWAIGAALRKQARGALREALAAKIQAGAVVVVDALGEVEKTKAAAEMLARLGAPRLALLLAVAMSIAWLLPNSQRAVGVGGAGEGTDGVVGLRWRASKGWAGAMGIVLAACVSDMQHVTEFLYFQF